MKHVIYPEKTGTITATSEDANYPATNLANDIRMKVWKAIDTVQTATLRVPISANAEVIALDNTNAETAICTITLDSAEQGLNAAPAVDEAGTLVGIPLTGHGYSAADVILLNGTTNYDGVYTLGSQAAGGVNEIIIDTGVAFVAETFAATDTACVVVETTTHTLETATRTFDSFWEEYTEQAAAHTATIKLTAGSGETVEAGIVRAGELYTIGNPKYGVNEVPVGYHIEKQYKSGAWYTKKREIVRSFAYTALLARSTKFRDLMDLYNYYGPDPFMMLLSDAPDIEPKHYTVFGKFNGEPSANHDYPDHSLINISVLEVV